MTIKTTGDYAKANDGSTYRCGPDGNYPASSAQANAPDVLSGSAAADWLQGAGGNDGVASDDRQSQIDVSAHGDDTPTLADQHERCLAHSVRGLTCVDASWHWPHLRRRPAARSPVSTATSGRLS